MAKKRANTLLTKAKAAGNVRATLEQLLATTSKRTQSDVLEVLNARASFEVTTSARELAKLIAEHANIPVTNHMVERWLRKHQN